MTEIRYQALTVASGIGSSSGVVPLNLIYPYVQFRSSAVVSGGVVIKLICVD